MAASLNPLLKSVSRSFYLSLRVLPTPVRPVMGVAYLLCRAADTVADTTLLPADRRAALITEIHDLFSIFPLPQARAERLCATLKEELSAEPSAERLLILRLDECLSAHSRLSNTDRALAQRVVVAVTTGMRDDLRRFGAGVEGAVTAMPRSADLESYIGWIGGEPGRFWTDVLAANGIRFSTDLATARELGFRFGTGLQMVNILRDLPEDLKAGRCYLPEERLVEAGVTPADLRDGTNEEKFRGLYHAMVGETVDRLEAGLSYIAALPKTAFMLRAAVWWPLALGLETLGRLRSAGTVLRPSARIRVPRREVYWLMATSLPELPFDRLLRADFSDLADAARPETGL